MLMWRDRKRWTSINRQSLWINFSNYSPSSCCHVKNNNASETSDRSAARGEKYFSVRVWKQAQLPRVSVDGKWNGPARPLLSSMRPITYMSHSVELHSADRVFFQNNIAFLPSWHFYIQAIWTMQSWKCKITRFLFCFGVQKLVDRLSWPRYSC